MATLLPARHALDLTGENPDNSVVGEVHVMVRRKIRCIALTHSPFFKKNVKIYDNGVLLTTAQYKCFNIIPLPSALAGPGNEVYSILAITDENVSDEVTVDYQSVGGDYVQSFEAVLDMIQTLSDDDRPASWNNVIDRPEFYDPSLHLHAVGDVIGWEYVAVALDQLKLAVLLGDAVGHDTILQYVDQQTASLSALVTAATAPGGIFGQHIVDQNNPHNTTKAQIGLALVQNFPVATVQEAIDGVATNRYMTPALTTQAINVMQATELGAHPEDTDNPHETNKAQVGLSQVENYRPATNAEGLAGTATNLYMTPASTAAVAAAAILAAEAETNAHIAEINNPHSVTKIQVGLGNVENFGTATPAETLAGTAANLFVTPLGLKAATDASELEQLAALDDHVNNTSNPHETTKEQVGLGNVMNYAVADEAASVAGVSNTLYMTPLGTKAVIDASDLSSKIDITEKGVADGVAPLDSAGQVPSEHLGLTPGSSIRDAEGFVNGLPAALATVLRFVTVRPTTYAINTDSRAYAGIQPTGVTVIEILKNDVVIGTVTFNPGSNVGTFAASGAVFVTFAAGDRLTLVCTGAQDATLADLIFTIYGGV